MKTLDQIIKEHISCTCAEIYISRNLTDLDCVYCEWGSEIKLMMEEFGKQCFEAGGELVDNPNWFKHRKYKTFEDYKNSLK